MKKRRRSPSQPKNPWAVPPMFEGQDVFILCGGPSLTKENIEKIRGKNVIAVNYVYKYCLWATMMFFADVRFWRRELTERPHMVKKFEGIIVTTARGISDADKSIKQLRHFRPPPGIHTADNKGVAIARSSLTAAINIAVHAKASRIILMGVDNRDIKHRAHFHTEYPWQRSQYTWKVKQQELFHVAEDLRKLNIPCINTSLQTTITYWPIVKLENILNENKNLGRN